VSLKPGDKANFETLERASAAGDLALVECTDIKTGAYVAVLCAMQREPDGGFTMIPLARMFAGDPFEEVIGPGPGDGT
jgi:hypothetical protein